MFNDAPIESITGLPKLTQALNNYYLIDTKEIDNEIIGNLTSRYLHPLEIKQLNGRKRILAKKEFIASRYLIKSLISQNVGLSRSSLLVEFNQSTKTLGVSKFGKLLPYQISLSHSNGMVFIGIVDNSLRTGVDIEKHKSTRDHLELAKNFFSENEISALAKTNDTKTEFYNYWTRKEAFAKMSQQSLTSILSLDIMQYSSDTYFYTSQIEDYSLCICCDKKSPDLSIKLLNINSIIHL